MHPVPQEACWLHYLWSEKDPLLPCLLAVFTHPCLWAQPVGPLCEIKISVLIDEDKGKRALVAIHNAFDF